MGLDRQEIETRKRSIESLYGPWTAHNLRLHDDVYTIRPGVVGGNEARVRRVVQLVTDLGHAPLGEMRVLDLGALEGLFAIEMAQRGADVVAVEGRQANLEKIKLARDALQLESLELRHEDVRQLDPERYGKFDVVLCLGLLYHLEPSSVFPLLEKIRDLCTDLLILETRVAPYPLFRYHHAGKDYWGLLGNEPPPDSPPFSSKVLWSSIGNKQSLELTKASLCDALADAGYSSVLECHLPPTGERKSRVTLAACVGPRVPIVSVPALNEQPWERLRQPSIPLEVKLRRLPVYRVVQALSPRWAKRLARRAVRRLAALRSPS